MHHFGYRWRYERSGTPRGMGFLFILFYFILFFHFFLPLVFASGGSLLIRGEGIHLPLYLRVPE